MAETIGEETDPNLCGMWVSGSFSGGNGARGYQFLGSRARKICGTASHLDGARDDFHTFAGNWPDLADLGWLEVYID